MDFFLISKASRGAAAQNVTVNAIGCGFDSRGNEIFIKNYIFIFFALVSTKSAALNYATQHAMPPEFSGKWGTECYVRDTA